MSEQNQKPTSSSPPFIIHGITRPIRVLHNEEIEEVRQPVMIRPPSIVATTSSAPELLLQAVIVERGPKTEDGQLIECVGVAWLEILDQLGRDPDFLNRIPWDKMEELVAAAYVKDGWKVELTPRGRKGDKGRDIIARRHDFGAFRIVDQIKRFKPGRLVRADDVRAVLGVLTAEQNISKGFITTTADFAPGIKADADVKRFMPYRLELRDRKSLIEWLQTIKRKST